MPRDEAATIVAPDAAANAVPSADARLAVVPARKSLAEVLLHPSAIALIGAGDDIGDARGRPLHLLRQGGFDGKVYPINMNRRLVQGIHAWPAVSALPGPVDLAFILLDGDAAIDAVEACGRARIPLAAIHGTLTGDAAQVSRERLIEAGRRHDVRILGPGSAGLVVPGSDLALTTDAAFAARRPRGG